VAKEVNRIDELEEKVKLIVDAMKNHWKEIGEINKDLKFLKTLAVDTDKALIEHKSERDPHNPAVMRD